MKEGKSGVMQEQGADLMEKAAKMMLDYNQATGCSICIYNSDCMPQLTNITGNFSPERTICPFCAKFRECGQNAFPCHEMHVNAIKEANKRGGSHIYACEMGLQFWTSPIYTEGSFSGAVRGSGFLKECKKTVDIFLNANDTHVMCNNEITQDEFKERVNSIPEADGEKVQSLAEMMQLCAESLSSGSTDYHEILKRRTEQQEAITAIIGELEKKYPENAEKPGYSLEKEKLFMSTLRNCDPAETKKQLNELLAMLFFSNPGQFKYIQLRITELVVLISRIEVSPGKGVNLSMEANSQSLKQVQEAKTIEELTDILHIMVDRVLNIISSFRGIPHAAALRKAESFILENYTRKISLKEIAAVAGLSPPYFSTIFKEEMGENLSKYLNRLRVEKASRLLLETEMSLSEIATCCCFEDQSWFSKIFKAYTGISPGKYRNQGGGIIRDISDNNLSQAFRKTLK
ncbi:MAG: helix-turn-helix domain-containing protein [Treponema sp.]|jgi:AraC-like DNA-binding protein/ligand-binding sensor protein|nr:helix-turn-helix domain-containing protein [Treponema sp.]